MIAVCAGILVIWFLYGFASFWWGWIRLDPLCRTAHYQGSPYVIHDLYTPEAAVKLQDAIAAEYSNEVVRIDDNGVVYIRPVIYHADFGELDRYGQLVVRPEDRLHLYQTQRLSCEELQAIVRSKIDLSDARRLRYSYSFYLFVLQPDRSTLGRWASAYRD
ncbi:MAG: hypothetical protein AAF563_07420 [Pseudomonadota bacterium]